jgi:hypothetical protein
MAVPPKFSETWAQICKKAWQDEAFKEKLLKNPEAVFKEFGLSLPSGYKRVAIHNEEDGTLHLALKARPRVGLEQSELKNFAAGTSGEHHVDSSSA